MADSTTVKSMKSSTTTIKNAPKVTLLKWTHFLILCPLLNFFCGVFERIFKDKVHFILNGTNEVLLLLLNFD